MDTPQPSNQCLTVHASDQRLAQLTDRMATVYEGFGQFTRAQIEAAMWAWLTSTVDTLLSEGDSLDLCWDRFDAALINQKGGRA